MNGGLSGGSSPWRRRVLGLSFLESFATILLERGIYFFSHERLGYSEAENLGLAAGFGAAYALGAWRSHGLAARVGDRRALVALLVALCAVHVLLAFVPRGALLALGFVVVGLLEGAKWPVVESYVAAGLGPDEQLEAVGRFNVSWALAVPLAIATTGPIVAFADASALFLLAAVLNVASLACLIRVPRSAPHLDAGHPSRPLAHVLERYRPLLASSRWTMLSSYALMFLIAPLLPEVFRRLGRDVEEATLWASWLDAVRVFTFALLAIIPSWHGKLSPLLFAALGLPLGAAAILLGSQLWLVVLGEIIFGVLAGVTYYAALYYALVVKNAAVDAGGAHEGLIGIGLVLGPSLGLMGQLVARGGGDYWAGIMLGAAPLIAACWFGALRSLAKLRAR